MLVLSIDTSTPALTVALVRVKQPHELISQWQAAGPDSSVRLDPDELLAERVVDDAFGHVEKLMPLVDEVVGVASRTLRDLSAVVVGIGPGPFTGLRVGMVTAAALGDALGIPVHGVVSHDAMAQAAASASKGGSAGPGVAEDSVAGGDFLVVTDARRKEVHVSGYRVVHDDSAVRRDEAAPAQAVAPMLRVSAAQRIVGPDVVAPADLPDLLRARQFKPRWMTGAAAPLVESFLDGDPRPIAGSVGRALVQMAHGALVTGAVPGPLTPLYLRRPDAAEPHAPKSVLGDGART